MGPTLLHYFRLPLLLLLLYCQALNGKCKQRILQCRLSSNTLFCLTCAVHNFTQVHMSSLLNRCMYVKEYNLKIKKRLDMWNAFYVIFAPVMATNLWHVSVWVTRQVFIATMWKKIFSRQSKTTGNARKSFNASKGMISHAFPNSVDGHGQSWFLRYELTFSKRLRPVLLYWTL